MAGMEMLRRQRDIDRVFRGGRWQRMPAVAVGVYERGDADATRVAFVAGRRVGTAVRRNRSRRRLREAWRLMADRIRPGADVVAVARDRTADVDFRRLQDEMRRALAAAGLLDGADDRR